MNKQYLHLISAAAGIILGMLLMVSTVKTTKEIRFVHDTIVVHDTIRFAK